MAKNRPKRDGKQVLPPFLAGDDKRSTVLRAAHKLFLRDGFSATSMDAVTQEAGVSKATVYAYFDSKQRLFEALIELGSESAINPATALVRSGGDPRHELHAFFSRFLNMLFSSGGYAWERMLIAEAPRHAKAAEHFYNCTLERITGVVERYLGDLAGEGLFPAGEVRLAAEALVAMVVLGPLHRALLLGPQTIDLQATLTFGIDTLLARATPGGPDSKPQRVTSTGKIPR